MHGFLIVSVLLCLACFSIGEARPAAASLPHSFSTLEWALRRVLRDITCTELTPSELKEQFRNNVNITQDVKGMLKKIDIQEEAEGCKRVRPLYFLDFRKGIHPNCTSHSLPRLRLIESKTPVFPPYYMDWECTESYSNEVEVGGLQFQVRNYELLQQTNDCPQGTAEWRYIEGAISHPLSVTEKCKCTRPGHT